ncbi:MAG: hypothetical protein K8R59_05595, partial [Thermoanaerobaculales bacterium]|nr:hypothetical protein [Thermoanaerobaculales bacterium]
AGVGHLETPYAEEMIIAFEMQVAPETSVELTYIDKQTKSMIEDTCSNNTWIWTDDPAPSLDDPSSWTTLGDCDHYMITNIDSFYREYNALIAKVETRGDWWHGMLSWTHSESKGNATSDATWSYAQALGDAFPTDFYNRDGYLGDHHENRFKWSGYLLLPWDVTVGLDGWWSDVGHQTVHSTCLNYVGADEAVLDFYGITDEQQQYCYSGDGYLLGTIFLEPRGSTTTKSVWNMDFQVSKAFSIGSYDLSAIFSVYNLFGHEQDRAFNSTAFRQTTEETGLGDPVDTGNRDIDGNILYDYYIPIGKPLGYSLPRRYEIGFRVEF